MIAVCITTGFLLRKYNVVPAGSHKGINVWLLYLALPAVSLRYIPKIEWSVQMLFPMASTIIVWIGSWFFIRYYANYRHYGQRTRSSLELASGYSNTSFLGFPLIIAYFGEQYLSIAVICDQVLFILLSTAGIVAAIKGDRSSGGNVEIKMILKKLITFPPFIGCMSALILPNFIDLAPAESFLSKLTATIAPLALFTVGLQLNFNGWKKQLPQISMSSFYKLIIAPILVLVIALIIGIKGKVAAISVFEASMPTFITASVVAEQFNLNSKLINLIVGIGILISFVSTGIWVLVINQILF